MSLVNPVDYAIPGFIALILTEMLIARARAPERYCPRDTLTSLLLGLGSTAAGALSAGLVLGVFGWLAHFRIVTIPYSWWAWVACFILYDLAYYWFHRGAHRIRWLWAVHVIHHSSQHYNLSTALRQTWTGFVSGAFLYPAPLLLLGFPLPMILFCGGLNLVYQFWIHTEVVRRCPPWVEAVMNTPAHHRVHHATNPRYLDHNYAGVFIVWDQLFGSFTPERDDEACRYGIVKQLGTFNVLTAAFHEWIAIARDVWRAPWAAKLGYLAREPGWSHDRSRETSAMIRCRWEEQNACRTNSTSWSSAEVLVEALPPDASVKAGATASA